MKGLSIQCRGNNQSVFKSLDKRKMLITFKSKASADVIMLENLAQYLLSIVGKQLGERGVISSEELPSIISRLENAVIVDNEHVKDEAANHHSHHEDNDAKEKEERLRLGQRAYPFLDMLRAAKAQNADILWGL